MRPIRLLPLSLISLVVGLITGIGAVVFRGLIGLVHNIFFLGHATFAYNSSVFTPFNPWGPLVILVPVIGGIGVTWIVSNFAPEAKGHGVPEVMDAIYYQRGIIRPVVAVVKSIASALAIGSGAAVGREGPIIQIGSALGSTLGQILRMQAGQRITLVAAGAGAGIAATFNTPIGGVLFATELMLPEISVNTFLPVAVATGTATFIGRLFFGVQPAFSVPSNLASIPNQPGSALTLALYALMGALIGVAAAGFIRGLHWLEDRFDTVPGRYLRHGLGMLLVGLLMYGFWRMAGHYYVEGVGYATIQATLYSHIVGIGFFLLLFIGKLLATTISLGSGSSGGIFSPSLFMGAALGAAFASIVTTLFPGAPVSVPAFAMVGMGAMVGGSTGAAMTAVTMIFEMTRDYDIVLPMILAVALALGVRRMLSRESIYTLKLVRRGHPIPKALHANMFLVRSAAEIMERDVLVLDEGTAFAEFLAIAAAEGGLRHVVVTRAGSIAGGLRVNTDLRRALGAAAGDVPMGALVRPNFIIVSETDVAFDVIKTIRNKRAAMAIVISRAGGAGPERVLGVITKEHVADTVARSIQIYPG
ncbi:MAG TPA: chloride channel protein [Acetobacteraceae bacterium]|nr:chloride channel protein [Acetobacteraceae bacterium]